MQPTEPPRALSWLDAAGLIVGVIIGAGIYQVSPDVARGAASVPRLLLLWALGGALSWCGAMVYAELATSFPRTGGDYVYLSRAYGPWAGFLFGWLQTVVIRPGDIAAMAFAFATYARVVCGGSHAEPVVSDSALAAGVIALLTLIHVAGVRFGTRTQNFLTAVKVLGLATLIVLASWVRGEPRDGPMEPFPASVALILVLFTYGGWNEIAYVAGEIRDPSRNIVRALAAGLGSVTLLYLLANLAMVHALGGIVGLGTSRAPAAESLAGALPGADRWVAALIAVSALGAVHGLIFSGARIPAAVGRDHPWFRALGEWNPCTGSPVRALLVQGALAIALVLVLGSFVHTVLYTAAPVYLFYLATTLALPILRRQTSEAPPVRMWGYPITWAAFTMACAWLAWSAVRYRPSTAAASLILALLGLPLWVVLRRIRPHEDPVRNA